MTNNKQKGCGKNYGLGKCGDESCKIGCNRIILCRECRLKIEGFNDAIDEVDKWFIKKYYGDDRIETEVYDEIINKLNSMRKK